MVFRMNRALTKDEKIAVIQRGMARLPAMGLEAQWAFGRPVPGDFVPPPDWVRRAAMMTFGVDPDKGPSGQSDPLESFKALGALFGMAEGAEIVFRPDKTAEADLHSTTFNAEKLKKGIREAASPHLTQFDENAPLVRRAIREGTADQYAAFTVGQSDTAREMAAEEKEPGSTTDMTHSLVVFLWMFWPELPLAGSVRQLHQWITDLDYLHCSEELVEKVCGKIGLRLSKRGRPKGIPTK